MAWKAGRTLLLAGVFAVALGPDAALAQRRVRISSVEITPAEAAVVVGQQQVFFAVAYDASNNPAATATFTFTTGNVRVARVNADGVATGINPGTTIITARTGAGAAAKSASATLTVVGVAGGLVASRSRVGLGVGERYPVSVQLLDERRQPIGPATGLRWTSSNDSVARYAGGQVQGLAPGWARLTARTPWDSTVSVEVFVALPILVSAQRGGRWDLYAMTADSAPRFWPMTSDAAVELEPAWAPDLTRIAYVTAPPERPTSTELYVANADGSESRRVTNDSAIVSSPVFVRPAGNQIVYQSNRGGRAQLYAINLDGTGRRQLTGGASPNTQPDVSPDGSRVLFVSLRQFEGSQRTYDIWQMNMDGTGERRLTTSPQHEDSPQYASDGRSFYFLRFGSGSPPTRRLYRQSLTDSAVALPVTPVGLWVRAFSVSADGSLIILTVLEAIRGVGDVPRVVLFEPASGLMTPVRVGPGEHLVGPVFLPAAPAPR